MGLGVPEQIPDERAKSLHAESDAYWALLTQQQAEYAAQRHALANALLAAQLQFQLVAADADPERATPLEALGRSLDLMGELLRSGPSGHPV